MGGVAAAGPVVPAGAAADGSPAAPADAPERTGPGRPARGAATPAATPQRRAQRPARWRPSVVAAPAAPGSAVPVDWHRSTMAHLCSMYPFHADRGFGEAGVYFGHQRHRRARRLLLRPVRVLRRRLVENPNMIVTGTIGSAKSGTVKALIKRSRAVYPDRFIAVFDPKGEYLRWPTGSASPSSSCSPAAATSSTRWRPTATATPTTPSWPARAWACQMVAGVLGRPARRRRGGGDRRGRSASCRDAGRCSRSATSTPSSTPRTRSCCGSPGCQPVGDGQDPRRRPLRPGRSCATGRCAACSTARPTSPSTGARPRRRVGPVGDPQRPAGAAAGHAGRHLLARRGDAPTRAARSCRSSTRPGRRSATAPATCSHR